MIEWISVRDGVPMDQVNLLIRFSIIGGGEESSLCTGWWCDKEGFILDIGEYSHRYMVDAWVELSFVNKVIIDKADK